MIIPLSNLNSTGILTWISEYNGPYHHNMEKNTLGDVLSVRKISRCGHLFQIWVYESLPGKIIKCESLEM